MNIWGTWDRYMVICHMVMCTILLHDKQSKGTHHHVHMFIYKYLSLNICSNSGQISDYTYDWKKTKIRPSLKGDLLTVQKIIFFYKYEEIPLWRIDPIHFPSLRICKIT